MLLDPVVEQEAGYRGGEERGEEPRAGAFLRERRSAIRGALEDARAVEPEHGEQRPGLDTIRRRS